MFIRNLNIVSKLCFNKFKINFTKRYTTSSDVLNTQSEKSEKKYESVPDYMDFKGKWELNEKQSFLKDMSIINNFLSHEEEESLLNEIDPYLKRMHYEFDHWDDAIHGFRETERKQWYPNNKEIIKRIQKIAFNGDSTLPHIHVLDLSEKGVIKPHVDSIRYCGTKIAGLSLLTDSVMRLVRTNKNLLNNNNSSNEKDIRYQNINKKNNNSSVDLINNKYADILIKRFSLYIMRDSARYNFTHEILSNEHSQFKGKNIIKSRRISIICRNEP